MALLLAFGAGPSARAAFVPFENFNGLAVGALNGQNGWVANTANSTVVSDPAAPTNQVLSVANDTTAYAYKSLGALTLNTSAVGTVFWRFRRANTQMNISHGLSDTAAPTTGFGDFEAQLNSNGTNPPNLNVRDAGAFKVVGQFEPDAWYSVWMVVDNPRDLYSVYLQGGALTTPTLLTSSGESLFTFRNTGGDTVNGNSSPVASNLVTFLMRSSGNSNHVGPFFLDDLYIDPSGTNLTNPLQGAGPPVVVGVSPAPGSMVAALTSIAVTFSEPVTNVFATNLLVNGAPATGLAGTNATWTFTFPQPATGLVTVAWATTQAIRNLSGLLFAGAAPWSYTVTPVPPGFVLFDKFDNLAAGPSNGQNGWSTANSAFQIGADPVDALNKVLIAPAMSESPLFKALGVLTISNGTTGTLFFRMRRDGAPLNVSAGLSDLANPSAGFADYEAQINCNTTGTNNLNVRDGGVFDAVDTFASNAWLRVWMVVDNARDLVSVFLRGGHLAGQTLLDGNTDGETAFTFRNSTGDGFNTNPGPQANDLVTFLLRIGGSHTGPFYVDDIYLDPRAANLADPLGPDTNGPVLVQTQPAPGATVYALGAVTVTFSEPVQNVAAGDLLVNGAPATNVAGSWMTWTFSFPQPATGVVSMAWAPTQNITDSAGNRFNHTNANWTCTLLEPDTRPPGVLAVWPAPGATLSNWGAIVVTFEEPVAGVEAAALLVNGAPGTAVTNSGNSWSFTAPPPPPGPVSVAFDPGRAIVDLFGNLFDATRAGHRWSYTFMDTAPPFITATTPAPGATVTRLEAVDVQFNEAVLGVEAADLLLNGAPATNVTGAESGPYRFTFAPPPPGTVQFAWTGGHGIADMFGNPFAGGSWSNRLVGSEALGRVIINEFLASNVKGLTNEFGDTEDWIELYNAGTNVVNLLGWALTDDARHPDRWTFPDLTLQPGGYLVVFADGRDLKTSGGASRLHTSFKLNDQGDYLALLNADSPPAVMSEFHPQFPEQRADYSFGLNPSNHWRYFATPTPGGPNGDSAIAGVTPFPHVSAGRGLYEQPFTLLAACPLPGATLRYTTDGSLPTEANGATWSGPVVISNTTIFRLAAFAANLLPSRVSTHSYLFVDQVLRQPNDPPGYPIGTNVWTGYPADYEMDPEIVTNRPAFARASLLSLPTLSLAMKVDDLFGPANGIYTHPEASPRELWERACSAEFMLTNGQTGFQVDCGIRVQGNASRTPQKTPKHPFRLFFRGAYGPGRLEYPLFEHSPVRSFNTIVLRADFNGSWIHWNHQQRALGAKVRDAWTKESFRALTGTASHSRPFHLYLNGIYWGVYDFGERIDAEWAASYFGGEAGEWDAIASKPVEAIDGTLTAYNAMVALGRGTDMRQPANYVALQQRLDLPGFLDYMLLNFYGANVDWGYDGNWNAVYRRAPGGRFKYATWDGELVAIFTNDNRVSADLGGLGLGGNQGLPSGLHTNLTNSAQYRMDFADRAHKHCLNDGALTPGPAAERWMARAREVEPGMMAESARWGDYRRDVHQYSTGPYELYTTNAFWWPEILRMRDTYFPVRTDIFLNQLRAAGLYPNLAAPVFSQHGRRVSRGFALGMSASNAIYYTTNGADPRLPFTGGLAPEAMLYTGPVTLPASMVVKARTFDGANWSALNEATFEVAELLPTLHVTEIMYNPPGGDAYEFIELRHDGALPLDLGGWSFEGIDFTFSDGARLAPGQIIILANGLNPAAFASRYPGVSVFGWYYGSRLDNGGERLALRKPGGEIVLSVDYRDHAGWPKGADGAGYSLEINDPFGDPDAASNWRATTLNGTPGAVPAPPAPGPVRLNEVMADNVGAVANGPAWPDWVELHNASDSDVSLANWSLTDSSEPRRFVFTADTVLPAGGFLVVWCDTNVALPGLHAGFSLDRDGETVSLFNAATARVDALTFGLQLPDLSVGRVAGDWALTLPTPGTGNLAAPVAGLTNLVINEWLANAPPGGSDWLELFNPAAAPLAWRGLWVAQGNSFHQVQSLSFLGSLGHVQLLADEQAGGRHLDFKLPAGGGTVALYDDAAVEFTRVTYGPQSERVSEGRLPDATTAMTNFVLSPSPGASNYVVAHAGPRLNEVMALNRGAVTNALGATPDWVELHNPLGEDFDLTGFRLSTVFGNPAQWAFPRGTMIPANGYRVVWFDATRPASAALEPELNTGQSLDGDSDEVYLFNREGLVVDAVEFGPQASDWSIGRVGGPWTLLASPTAGGVNAAAAALGSPAGLRLNEWLARAGPEQDEFVELFNSGFQPVALAGLYLTDDLSLPGLTKFQIPPLSFVAPLGFTEFKADGERSKGRDHLNFRLDADGESVRLSSPTLGILDTMAFGLQSQGISEGRLPDGAPAVAPIACPTPGLSNALSSVIVVTSQPRSQTALPGATVRFEVTAAGGGPLRYQWFFNDAAIRNATNATLALANVQFTDAGSYVVRVTNACASVASAPALLSIAPPPPAGGILAFQGANVLMAFSGVPSLTYTVQRTETLSPPGWVSLGSVEATALGVIQFLDTNAPSGQAFYRVVWP